MPSSPPLPVFSARGLTKVYRMGATEVHALRGIDLDLFEGEFAVLLGASGSGKSTLLNILGGLDTPTAGTVAYRGRALTGSKAADLTGFRRTEVGFVFQFYNLVPALTALENVALVTEIATDPMDPLEALERVGLADRRDHFPAQLSGGEQQRVAIARAVAKRPRVLVCDEPTGALDYPTGKRVLQVLQDANRDLGALTLVITHNAAIARIASRVLRISSGQLTDDRRNPEPASLDEISW